MGMFDNLVARESGQPRSPEVPGGAPGISRPAAVVNPPAAASGPAGRPPSPAPPFPGGPGQALPTSPVARPAAAPTGGPVRGTPPRPPAAPAQPAQREPVAMPAQPQSPTAGMGSNPFVLKLDRVPSPAEMSQLPPGVQVETPFGTLDERGELQLSPEGRERHAQAVAARMKSFGPAPAFTADPSAPKPRVRLGRRMINPFTGQWIR